MSQLGTPTVTISITIPSACTSFVLTDTTGVYSATNTGGYNTAVNIPSSAVQTVKVRVYQYGATVPTLFTFTVLTNVVTAATCTKPDGTVTNILADLSNTAWPFTGASAFNILGTYLGFASGQKLSDQVWTIAYEIIGVYSNGGIDYDFDLTTSNDELVSCNTCCCVKKMAANLKTNCCECGDALMRYLKANAMLESAEACADIGEYDSAQKAIMKASELCDQSCTSC